MPLRRKRMRDTDSIIISSSSDTSEASEDNALESDIDGLSRYGRLDAGPDMSSQRQTSKLNSGSFGMFNNLTLASRTRGKAGSEKKRRRVRELSSYGKPSKGERPGKERHRTLVAIESEGEREEDSSLFIPDDSAQSQLIVDGDESEDEEALYSSMGSQRAERAKEYFSALDLAAKAQKTLQDAETELSTMTTSHADFSWKLASIDVTAENEISNIIRKRDEAIRIASELADAEIKIIRAGLPEKKEGYERQLQECAERKTESEALVVQAKAVVEQTSAEKHRLECEGGFQLCSDVRDIQERGKKRRN